MVKKWSNNDAKLDLKPQGAFTLFGGMVTGEFVKIVGSHDKFLFFRGKR